MNQVFCLFLLLCTLTLPAKIFAKPSAVNWKIDNELHVEEIVEAIEEASGWDRPSDTAHNGAEIPREIHANDAIVTTPGNGIHSTAETVDAIHPNETVHGTPASETHVNHTALNTTDKTLTQLTQRLLRELRSNPYYSYPSGLSCATCTIFLDVAREFWSEPGITRALANHFLISSCISLRVQHPDVCRGIVREFQKEFYHIFGTVHLSTESICSTVLNKKCGDENLVDKPWSITLPNTQKSPEEEQKPVKEDSPVLQVLHLTDLHIDLLYEENTSTLCGEPLCCRENNGAGDAGYWGSYGCDIPLRTLESALKHVRQNNNDISYIILTGDIPPHDVWLETNSTVIEVMRRVFEKIKEYFPDKKVFVSVGNHDTHPVNSFPPSSVSPQYSIQWLLDSYADMWSAWLPDTSLHTVRKGGFFTTLISPGFRIVSINNNYCNKLNWWLLLNNTDPVGELQWLVQVLQAAEDNAEKVHVIAHIPTGNNLCYKYWSWNYYKIINRYENTVKAQFCGHTHQDHFEIFYDLNDHTRPISVMYVAPSLTTNDAYQPAFRIYEIEGDYDHSSKRVVDHKTYKLNLEKSNKDRKAYWELEYRAKEAYDMLGVTPSHWNNLVTRLENDDGLFQKFYRYKYRYPNEEPCDKDCKTRELCALKSAKSHDSTFCETTAEHVIF